MQIPNSTTFFFRCSRHETRLQGTPKLVHPNPEATAVWTFDTSKMWCREGNNYDNDPTNNCKSTWEVRA